MNDLLVSIGIAGVQIIIIIIRLPSNLKQTTRECVYFRSRDKDGGHTIRSAIAQNHILHVNFTALFSTEPELLLSEILHCRNTEFRAFFAAVTLTLTR